MEATPGRGHASDCCSRLSMVYCGVLSLALASSPECLRRYSEVSLVNLLGPGTAFRAFSQNKHAHHPFVSKLSYC